MPTMTLRDQVIDEVQRIPDAHLAQVFDLLHFFRIGLEADRSHPADTLMAFAGAWKDMDDAVFDEFQEQLASRRHQAFKHRRGEHGADLG